MSNIVKIKESEEISLKSRLLLDIALAPSEEEKNLAMKRYNNYIKYVEKEKN